MCKKLLVLTKSCWSGTDGLALVSNTGNVLLSSSTLAKRLPEPMLTACRVDPQEQTCEILTKFQ